MGNITLKKFDKQWAKRSYEDFDKWLQYENKIGPGLVDIALKWKILYHPIKDGKEDKEHISFTPEFQSYWRSEMRFLFDANEKILDKVVARGELSAFLEYGFVQIISEYIGMDRPQYNNLPRRDPDKLKTLFEVSEIVYRELDNTIDKGKWDKKAEAQDEMLKERKNFKDKIS